jgi:hypothetical protein
LLLLVLDVDNVGADDLASGEGVSKDDRTLLNYLENVSHAKIFIWLVVLSWFFVFSLGATFDKVSDWREIYGGVAARMAKPEEANAQLHAELNAARSRGWASWTGFDLRIWRPSQKLWWFAHFTRCHCERESRFGEDRAWESATISKLTMQEIGWASGWYGGDSSWAGGRCLHFPSANTTVIDFLESFWTEVQALPITFSECNENITWYAWIGVFKMLAGVEYGHLLELKKLVLSCDDSLLHDVPDDVGRIAKKLVKNWWVKHGLSYYMQKIEKRTVWASSWWFLICGSVLLSNRFVFHSRRLRRIPQVMVLTRMLM